MIENLESVLEERREFKLLNKMTNQIKIFNSEKEAKGLEGTFIDNTTIFDGNDILDCFFYLFNGKLTAMHRLKSVAKERAGLCEADYGIIAKTYNVSPNSQRLLAIDVNFYKNNLK